MGLCILPPSALSADHRRARFLRGGDCQGMTSWYQHHTTLGDTDLGEA